MAEELKNPTEEELFAQMTGKPADPEPATETQEAEPETVEAEQVAEAAEPETTEPEQETEPEPEVTAEAGEAEPTGEDRSDGSERVTSIPKQQYDKINRKRHAAEEALEAERAQTAKLAQEIEQIKGFLQGQAAAQQRPAQEAEEELDIYAEPEKVIEKMRSDFQAELAHTRMQNSVMTAQTFDPEGFQAGIKALADNGDDIAAQRIMASPNPGAAIIEYGRNARVLSEVGDDPNAYREKLAAEIREELQNDPAFQQQVLSNARGAATPTDASGKPVVNLPPGVNGGVSSADNLRPVVADRTEEEMFSHVTRPR